MTFKVDTTASAPQVFIVCEGHLDAEAVVAIERRWEVAEAAGLHPVIRVRRGATADRPVVARLAGYPVDQLEVEPPFLRSWLEELRAARATTAECGSEERAGSGSEAR